MSNKNKKSDVKELTESQKIWNEIKELELEIFGLPNQKVKNHAKELLNISNTELYLTLKSTAAFAALEAALLKKGSPYTLKVVDKYTVVTRA